MTRVLARAIIADARKCGGSDGECLYCINKAVTGHNGYHELFDLSEQITVIARGCA